MTLKKLEKLAGDFAIKVHEIYGDGDIKKAQEVYQITLDLLCKIYCEMKDDEPCKEQEAE